MKYLRACLLAVGLGLPAASAAPTLQEARTRWLHGNYEEARELYDALRGRGSQAQKDAAAVGLSRVEQSQGRYDQALAVIDAALKDSPKNADLHARRAELLHLRGKWDEAEKAAAEAIRLQSGQLLAHWVRLQLYRDRGSMKKADGEARWFIRAYNDQDLKEPDALLLVGLAALENARWNNLSDQFGFVLNEVYGDALKAEKDFWPAQCEAGGLLLEKYNRGEALDAFDKALAINPQAAEALVGKGTAALQTFEMRSAEQFAVRALSINPNLVEALQLRADVWLAGGRIDRALDVLERARRTDPRDENTLGRIAACYVLARKPDDFRKLAAAVERQDQRPGPFYSVLASQLEDRRRFDVAEQYYKKAIELRPMVPWAKNGLGLLYMRLGREKEARDLLTKSFEADPFNVRVANTLKVLRHLERYETLKTPHFVLKFDPKHDRLLAKYLAKYLEDTYSKLTAKFRFRPKEPYLVEVFRTHDMFSGRVVALPDLHTIGACTGRMVAMVSPHGEGIRKPFNWARVVHHEVTHLFNLEQTAFRVPHWYTEGLAVINEGYPRPQEWNELLLERVPAGKLMNLDDIDLGFIRPRGPDEWQLAYCQSQLYVQYMTEKYGPQTVGDLLDAYHDGLDTDAAIARVCKLDKAAFERGYRAYLNKVVQGIHGKPPAKQMKFTELRTAYEKDPENTDVAALLAEQYLERERSAEARKLADAVLSRRNNQPLASYVKARLLDRAGDNDGAAKLLEAVADANPPEPKVLEFLGEVYSRTAKFDKAVQIYELARKSEPYESKWLKLLTGVYAKSGDKDKLIDTLKRLAPTDADDVASRKRLAKLLVAAKRYPEAEAYAKEALEIDVLDAGVHTLLGDALLGQGKLHEAADTYRTALELQPADDDARLKLVQAYVDGGDRKAAKQELEKVQDPNSPDAQRLRKLLDQ
jgi:tetratricopeptide (TPR) repeat protein